MNYTEIEIEWMKEILQDKEEEIKKLKSDLWTVIDERDNAFKKIKQLEERLDNKEKVNKQLREDIGKLVMNNPS